MEWISHHSSSSVASSHTWFKGQQHSVNSAQRSALPSLQNPSRPGTYWTGQSEPNSVLQSVLGLCEKQSQHCELTTNVSWGPFPRQVMWRDKIVGFGLQTTHVNVINALCIVWKWHCGLKFFWWYYWCLFLWGWGGIKCNSQSWVVHSHAGNISAQVKSLSA
jgi:hypothetical protein